MPSRQVRVFGIVITLGVIIVVAGYIVVRNDSSRVSAPEPVSTNPVAAASPPAVRPSGNSALPGGRENLLLAMNVAGMQLQPSGRTRPVPTYIIEGTDVEVAVKGSDDVVSSITAILNPTFGDGRRPSLACAHLVANATGCELPDVSQQMATLFRAAAENMNRRVKGLEPLPAEFEVNGCIVDAFLLMDAKIAIGIRPAEL